MQNKVQLLYGLNKDHHTNAFVNTCPRMRPNTPMVTTGRLRTRSPIGWRPVIWWGVTGHRDGGMQPTAFGAQDRSDFEALLCCAPSAAADGQAVGRRPSTPSHSITSE